MNYNLTIKTATSIKLIDFVLYNLIENFIITIIVDILLKKLFFIATCYVSSNDYSFLMLCYVFNMKSRRYIMSRMKIDYK